MKLWQKLVALLFWPLGKFICLAVGSCTTNRLPSSILQRLSEKLSLTLGWKHCHRPTDWGQIAIVFSSPLWFVSHHWDCTSLSVIVYVTDHHMIVFWLLSRGGSGTSQMGANEGGHNSSWEGPGAQYVAELRILLVYLSESLRRLRQNGGPLGGHIFHRGPLTPPP